MIHDILLIKLRKFNYFLHVQLFLSSLKAFEFIFKCFNVLVRSKIVMFFVLLKLFQFLWAFEASKAFLKNILKFKKYILVTKSFQSFLSFIESFFKLSHVYRAFQTFQAFFCFSTQQIFKENLILNSEFSINFHFNAVKYKLKFHLQRLWRIESNYGSGTASISELVLLSSPEFSSVCSRATAAMK